MQQRLQPKRGISDTAGWYLALAGVVDYAIRFVSSNKSKENLESSANSSEDDKEESEEPDYDEEERQLEEKQEEQTGEMTMNQVF
jgi:hypothetical protein